MSDSKPRSLKVYCWIVAAPSWAEAARLAGRSVHQIKQFGNITGNKLHVATAMSRPGIVFRTTGEYGPPDNYRAVALEPVKQKAPDSTDLLSRWRRVIKGL